MADLHSVEAEQSLLGGLMLAPERFADVAERVREEDFSQHGHGVHRRIWGAMRALSRDGKPVDLMTVADFLEASNTLQSGDFAYLGVLARDTPSAANVMAYAAIVQQRAKRRSLAEMGANLQRWALESGDPEQVLLKLQAAISALDTGEATEGPVSLKSLINPVITDMDQRANGVAPKGLPSCWADLNATIPAFYPGDLVVVAGRPAMGKSVFGLQLAAHAARLTRRAVLFDTAEMPNAAQVTRLIAGDARVPLKSLKTGSLTEDDWARVSGAAAALAQVPIWLDERPSPSIDWVESQARKLKRAQGELSMIAIDHAGLVVGRGATREQQQADVGRSLKSLAKEIGCPVLAMVQLNRKLEERGDKRPIMSDLRDSGEWEQSADVVLMLYRDEVYNPDSADKGCAEIIIRKHRDGELGTVPMAFVGEFSRFEPLVGGLPSWSAPKIRRERGLTL